MTVRRGLVVAVHWAATLLTALTATAVLPALFSGPYAPAVGLVAAAGIALTGLATAPSTTRKARS